MKKKNSDGIDSTSTTRCKQAELQLSQCCNKKIIGMSGKFHKAAREGALETLKQTTKRDCNDKDEDGMTPTLWAAFDGNLEALRLLVARGGDPDKSDNFGNSALHHSAERGHVTCVRFLTHFGANLWSLNCKMHTPKELAAMNNKGEVLRFLDAVMAEQEATKKKEVKAKKEKAQKEAEKKLKEYEKMQKKTEKYAEKEQKRLEKQREKMGEKTSAVLQALKNKAIVKAPLKGNSPSPRFSEIVGTITESNANKFGIGAVHKKIQQKKFDSQRGDPAQNGDFKVVEIEDGKKSVKNLTGLRRDSEILYVGTFDKDKSSAGVRGKLSDVFNKNDTIQNFEALNIGKNEFPKQDLTKERSSIFERPGFGSFAFRNSITAALNSYSTPLEEEEIKGIQGEESSIGSAGSLAKRQLARNSHIGHQWNLEQFPDEYCDMVDAEENDSLEYDESSPLQLFLISNGLVEYTDRFIAEKIDLESLLILTDEDLISLGLPMGPRRKLMAAINNRKKALEDPGKVLDSAL